MENPSSHALIVFAKPPLYGKVKTRLAASVGHERALQIYSGLLQHTIKLVESRKEQVHVYLSEQVAPSVFSLPFTTHIQQGEDLGDRMSDAFRRHAGSRHSTVCIGSDCPQINQSILDQAFSALESFDVVFGPASDGGYYLVGMRTFREEVFRQIPWSTTSVLKRSLNQCLRNGLSVYLLPELRDLDTVEDLEFFSGKFDF